MCSAPKKNGGNTLAAKGADPNTAGSKITREKSPARAQSAGDRKTTCVQPNAAAVLQ